MKQILTAAKFPIQLVEFGGAKAFGEWRESHRER